MANVFGYSQSGAPPANMVTTNTSQLISATKTFSSESNVFYGDGSNLTGVTAELPANVVTTDAAGNQTITGQKTFSSGSNVFAGTTFTGGTFAGTHTGDGSGLTSLPAPTNMVTTDGAGNQTITGQKTFSQAAFTKINGPLYVDSLASTYPAVNSIYPIGYSTSYTETQVLNFTNSNNAAGAAAVSTSITLTPGVWMLLPFHSFSRGTVTIATDAITRVQFTDSAGTTLTVSPPLTNSIDSVNITTTTLAYMLCGMTPVIMTVTASTALYHKSVTIFNGANGTATSATTGRALFLGCVRIG